MYCAVPVSYTHLDVYKRQAEGIPEQKEPGSRMIERVERKQHEKTGITGPGQQPGGIKKCIYDSDDVSFSGANGRNGDQCGSCLLYTSLQ